MFFVTSVKEDEIASYKQRYQVTDMKREAGGYQIRYVNKTDDVGTGDTVTANLEDVYMYLTGKMI